jgi:diguanylate cyclase (GGDEF)-like protein
VSSLLIESAAQIEHILQELGERIEASVAEFPSSRSLKQLAQAHQCLDESVTHLLAQNLEYQSRLEFSQRRMAVLAELDLLNPSDTELPVTLQRIVDLVAQLMRVTGGAGILLWDGVHERFNAAASTFPELSAETILEHMPLHNTTHGPGPRWVVDQAQPLIVPDLPQHFREENLLAQTTGARGYAAFPILHRKAVLGVLFIIERQVRELHQDDLHFMHLMAQRSALAVLNSRRVAEAQNSAFTDPLTGVSNRRYFDQTFEYHWQSIGRHEPYCLVLLDIDHFKSINDTYGHSVGDEVLRIVAARLRDGLRKDDLLARYGGEEFAILLPRTNFESARHVAERLRITLARTSIDTSSGPIKVTASFGLATYQDWMSQPDLIREADYALYEAKSRGRNCVV